MVKCYNSSIRQLQIVGNKLVQDSCEMQCACNGADDFKMTLFVGEV